MIVTEFYNGQGLGNQLWCYFVTRVICENKGYEYGIKCPEKFKGREFITISFGNDVIGGSGPEGGPPVYLPNEIKYYYREKFQRHPNGMDISRFDDGLYNILDSTKIDGCMQSFNYIKDYRDIIFKWFEIKKNHVISDDVCLVHIRGGDFKGSSAILNSNYYLESINKMRDIGVNKFLVITDDVKFSKILLPDIEIYGSSTSGIKDLNQASHHIGGDISVDFSLLNSCKNVIISASSFSWWAVWLNKNIQNVIAPKYWAANSISDGYWSCGDSLVDGWTYLHNEKLYSYEECLLEKNEYEKKNKNYWL
jgi:hypothetical protein